MSRLARLESRLDDLERKMAAIANLKVVSDAPVNQLLSAQTNTAIPVKSGPTSGELNLDAGTLNLH